MKLSPDIMVCFLGSLNDDDFCQLREMLNKEYEIRAEVLRNKTLPCSFCRKEISFLSAIFAGVENRAFCSLDCAWEEEVNNATTPKVRERLATYPQW